MARATDRAGIQFRVLNASKEPAVRATRAQADRVLYKAAIREILEAQENLSIFQSAVDDLCCPTGWSVACELRWDWRLSARKLYSPLARFWAARFTSVWSKAAAVERVIHPLLRWQSVFGNSLSG